jgi:hypothetical protein
LNFNGKTICLVLVLLCLPLFAHGLVMPWKAPNKGDILPIKADNLSPRTLDEWSDNYIDQVDFLLLYFLSFLSPKTCFFFVAGFGQLAAAYSGPGTVATRNNTHKS